MAEAEDVRPAVVVSQVSDQVVHLQINRPEVRNALRKADKELISRVVREAGCDETRAIILSGSDPRAFCAGTDVKEMGSLGPQDAVAMFEAEGRLYSSLLESPVLVIAAVEGAAVGAGCILACCADIVIAGDNAMFQTPEVRLGLPAPLHTAILPQVVGLSWARRMLLTCEPVSAQQALAIGLTTEVVPAGEAVGRALELATSVSDFAPVGVRTQKALVRSWISGEYRTSVELSSYVAALALVQAGGSLPHPGVSGGMAR
jgi:enoyl-CoA hydratase